MELGTVRALVAEIEEVKRQLETLREVTIHIPQLTGMPKAKPTESVTEKTATAIVGMETELADLCNQLDAVVTPLAKEIIAKVGGMRGRVLILRYVACMKFSEIADALKLSQARIYALHSEGVKQFNSER